LKIVFLSVGSLKKGYIKEGFADYISRIKRYSKVDVVEVKEGLGTTKAPVKDVKKKEGVRILEKLKEGDRIIALDEAGKAQSSKELSKTLERALSGAFKRLVVITGGSYGLDASVIERAHDSLSLSKMTLPHELARLVISEQLYRAFTIIKGEPYSH
jgi:23S rRNA (pseudouridine1915-N3)-methyltransferase